MYACVSISAESRQVFGFMHLEFHLIFLAACHTNVYTYAYISVYSGRTSCRSKESITLQASLSGSLPPNSAVIGYAIEGALLISAHLYTEIALKSHAVSTLC